ncbi:hypothetical protein RF11_15866 [Thelohanellus kitauei]|uniref:Uncharacterized protein n=1 Tax=Thelohanellus kitauei TaxID=669202 RepID=A0A0C2N1P7_THEKT|nr:hypothetical protein RF11_15866 [Thelohanellus kitauei]
MGDSFGIESLGLPLQPKDKTMKKQIILKNRIDIHIKSYKICRYKHSSEMHRLKFQSFTMAESHRLPSSTPTSIDFCAIRSDSDFWFVKGTFNCFSFLRPPIKKSSCIYCKASLKKV